MPEHGTLAVLRERNIRYFVASRLASGTALMMLRATIAWHVWDLTGSELQLGLIGGVQLVPALALGLVGGAVADAYDRRRIILLGLAAQLAVAAALCRASLGGGATLWIVYAGVAAMGTANALAGPSRTALLPTLVPRELFPSAVTLHSTFQNLAWVSGPVAAGFTIEAGGVALAYGLCAALLVAAIGLLAGVRPRAAPGDRRALSARAVREGIAFVRGRAELWGAMALDMFAVIFASVTALLPVFAEEILAVGPRGYGVLSAAVEAGTLLMAAIMLLAPPLVRTGPALLVAVAGFGLATVVFGLSRSFPLSLAALVLAGMADQVSMVARASIVQLTTPDALRGRVSSVNQMFIGASNQLGTVESGLLAAATSAPFSVVFGGVACLGVMALAALRLPALRRHRIDR